MYVIEFGNDHLWIVIGFEFDTQDNTNWVDFGLCLTMFNPYCTMQWFHHCLMHD